MAVGHVSSKALSLRHYTQMKKNNKKTIKLMGYGIIQRCFRAKQILIEIFHSQPSYTVNPSSVQLKWALIKNKEQTRTAQTGAILIDF